MPRSAQEFESSELSLLRTVFFLPLQIWCLIISHFRTLPTHSTFFFFSPTLKFYFDIIIYVRGMCVSVNHSVMHKI